jgi:hypothetical protein
VKELWQIELIEDRGLWVGVKRFRVLRETEQQYHCEEVGKEGGGVKRVMKVYVDREHVLEGGGRWYSTKERGLGSYGGYHEEMAKRHRKISEAIYREILMSPGSWMR